MLTREVKTSLHLDANNALGCDDGLVKISPPFRGGGLWVQNKEGNVPSPGDASQLGDVIDFMQSVLTFDPRCKHLTLPWTQGPRIVLIGFVVKAPEAMPSLDADLFVRAGFNLPCQDIVTSFLRVCQLQVPSVCGPNQKLLCEHRLKVRPCSFICVQAQVSCLLRLSATLLTRSRLTFMGTSPGHVCTSWAPT